MINSLLSLFLGGCAAFGFMYPTYQLLVPISLMTGLYFNQHDLFKYMTIYIGSLHFFGSLWLLVPIHYIGGLNYFLSLFIISLLSSFYAFIYALIHKLSKLIVPSRTHWYLALPCVVVFFEYLKVNLMGGYPFLMFAYIAVDTPLANVIPFLGIYGCSWLLIFFSGLFVTYLQQKKYLNLIISMSLLYLCSQIIDLSHYQFSAKKPLNIYVTRTNKHYVKNHTINTLPSHHDIVDVDVMLFPEGMLHQSSALAYLDYQTFKLVGMTYRDNDNRAFNSMFGINKDNQITYIHKKHHLAQFNEWIPESVKSLLVYFKLPAQGFYAGDGKDTNGKINDTTFMGLICYELLFSHFIYQHIDDANIILSNNDLGWFENSAFENHFNQIASFMAILTHKPIVISSNIGHSLIIEPTGKKTLMNEHTRIQVTPFEGKTPWMYYGDSFVLGVIIMLSCLQFFILRFYLKDNLK